MLLRIQWRHGGFELRKTGIGSISALQCICHVGWCVDLPQRLVGHHMKVATSVSPAASIPLSDLRVGLHVAVMGTVAIRKAKFESISKDGVTPHSGEGGSQIDYPHKQ
ncbi:hypothetical protein DSO57_1024020 [Entomophthora muscae]|uniref:Uncharacterized protein n=1 Tax=Entomophthora muscae TaxID=34485 RepID=A0ACC2TDY9_9FUNG|nr:hypothetical protein DSO57_1024020 [Entomophthora muscae]